MYCGINDNEIVRGNVVLIGLNMSKARLQRPETKQTVPGIRDYERFTVADTKQRRSVKVKFRFGKVRLCSKQFRFKI